MFTRLVCSGGEFKGFAMLGAITVLEEQNILVGIQHFLGCSAGSIICFFLVLGYNSAEILHILKNKLQNNEINNLEIDDIFTFFENYGLDSGDFLRSILIDALHEKYGYLDIDFASLYQTTGKNLIVSGANISAQTLEYFHYETHGDMSVIEAIMISTCVPFIYKPIIYGNAYYCDAGIYNNFPICFFSENRADTIGISVKLRQDNYPITSFSGYLYALIMSVINKVTLLSLQELHTYHVCEIDITEKENFFNFSRLEFAINEQTITDYYKYGYLCFTKFYATLVGINLLTADIPSKILIP